MPTILNGSQYMQAVLYTGTGATQTISGLNFQPDFVWIKSRSAATDHKLTDSVRGVTKALISDSTAAESTDTNGVTAFTSNGFTIGSDSVYNANGATYVAWCWKANGAAVSNTNGSITSQVSASTLSGFSVVTYSGTGSTATVGHGLGVAPSMVIIKTRNTSNTNDWSTYHVSLGNGSRVFLCTTQASGASGAWNSTSPTASVFTVAGGYNELNYAGNTYVAYCFAAIAGYSAFGSYTGNGSTDGPFVYCGFRPRWLLVKRTDVANSWVLMDSSRSSFNYADKILWPNLSDAEANGGTTTSIDFVSNGFKQRGAGASINASGGTYVYAAFCEVPMNFALAR